MAQYTAPNTNQETPQAVAQAETDGNASVTATKGFTAPTPAAIATSFNREDFTVQSGSTSWTLGLNAPSLAADKEGAARSPLIDFGFNSRIDAQRQNGANPLGLPSLQSPSSTEYLKARLAEPLILDRGRNSFIDALDSLGVEKLFGKASVIPQKEYAQFGFLRDQESQVIRFNRDGTASYTIKGADYLSEITSWLSQGKVEVASATVLYDGKRVSLSPALTYETPLGFSATVASGFDQISSQRYNLTPEFDHLFSGTPSTKAQSNDPLNGSLFVNSYKTPQGFISTVDLSLSDRSSLSLVLANNGSENVVAVKEMSMLEIFGKSTQVELNGMYLHGRRDGVNSEAVAGVGTLTRDTDSNRIFLKVSGFGVNNETGVGNSWSTGASVLLEIMRK